MKNIFFNAKVMWSQIDANRHLRHSAYADFAAQARMEMLNKNGFDHYIAAKLNIGPILFREEIFYLKEVHPDEWIQVSCQLSKCRKDGSRYSLIQEIFKNDNTIAAKIIIDGAWIDLVKRKLTSLPEEYAEKFLAMPKTDDFFIEEINKK